MMDLLDGFIGDTQQEDQHAHVNYFSQHFWGEKNQGFDVLYHNMKHGQISVKDLQDFIKDKASVEEVYAKQMTKLAKQATNCSPLGTFFPLMDVLRVMTDKMSSCHMDIVLKMQDIVKDLSKYLEEQKTKHKQMKDQLCGTAEALHNLHLATTSAMKSKEKYNQLCIDAERLRRAGAPPKDVEKALTKSKKAAEEYRTSVEKYATIRDQFEDKMLKSTQEFQTIEEEHLHHMKQVLNTYIVSFENASVLINQVHQEFRRQVNENTIDHLIRQYSNQKGTGAEHPAPIFFEECDPAAILSVLENGTQYNHTTPSESSQPPVTTSKPKKETGGIFGLRRRKPKHRNDTATNSSGSKDSKDAESTESPDKEATEAKIDEEGYTIRPTASEDSSDKASFHFSSDSDSDSDSDDVMTRKIQVRIKPKDTRTDSGGSDLETLNAITKNLTLGSPSPLGMKKTIQSDPVIKQGRKSPSKSEKMTTEELLQLFDNKSSGGSPQSLPDKMQQRKDSDGEPLGDLFSLSASNRSLDDKMSTSRKGMAPAAPTIPPYSSSISKVLPPPDSQFNADIPPPRPPKPGQAQVLGRPNELSLNNGAKSTVNKDTSSFSAPLASSESWSSLSSGGGAGTPPQSQSDSYSFSSVSRGPSPLTLSYNDPIPIAVAFIETVNAYFKGNDESRSLTKVTGEVQISFPTGITRAFTSNPNPPTLSFRINCPNLNTISNISHDTNLLCSDRAGNNSSPCYAFNFDMPSLVAHVKRMTEKEPDSPYYNIHILSYQVASSHHTMPLHVTNTWKCEPNATEVKIDYKYNSITPSTAVLRNINVIVPIQGVVTDIQSTPQSTWNSAQNRLCWQIPGPVTPTTSSGTLCSKLTLTSGPSKPSTLAVQFLCDASNLSGADFELNGSGYRLSLVKKRFITGKYLCES